ncbi:MAG: glutaminyl-peptide cyclotransferase [Alistipes sp.]|nr:glutaminyl-peptide cyclotransferase [Alistipes sp.]
MKRFLATIFLISTCIGCGGNTNAHQYTTPAPIEPKQYGFEVVATYPHLTTSYTQGLQYVDGVMWEGTGQHGESRLQRIDLVTGKADVVAELPHNDFGEGITLLGDKIYQLTWTNNRAYVYDRNIERRIKIFHYTGEGWGLTTDGKSLYMTDGSARLSTIDPDTFRRTSSVMVTHRGEPVQLLNELEWIDGKIWANVYTTDKIVIIDPATGVVEGVIDLEGLLPESERTPSTDVLNGIAYDSVGKRIFVTGKNWSKLFEIKIIEQ